MAAMLHHLPLTAPPRLLAMAPGNRHGRHGDETYRTGFWVLNLVLGGGGTLAIGDASVPFADGTALVVPPGVPHRYRFAGPVTKVWAHFQPAAGAGTVPMPLASDLGGGLARFRADLTEAALGFAHEPEAATARVWDLLWRLRAGPVDGRAERTPLAERLLAHLEQHLDAPGDPAALARRFAVTTTHLNRVCKRATGLPLAAFVRRRRLELALHLLRGSGQPIAQIAAQVGYPDLSHFNKLMRAYAGRSPRALRQG